MIGPPHLNYSSVLGLVVLLLVDHHQSVFTLHLHRHQSGGGIPYPPPSLSTLHTLLLRQPRANFERRAPPRTTTGAPLVLLSTDDRPRLTQFVRPLLCCVNASVPVGHRSRGGRAACPSSYAVARAFQSWRGVQSVPNHPAGLRIHPPGGNSSLHLGLLPSPCSD